MTPETPATVAGHKFSEGRARFNRLAGIFLVICGINASAYMYSLGEAFSAGEPVSIYESNEPGVLSLEGKHARVEPEVYARTRSYGRITSGLLAIAFALKLSLYLVNARLPASTAPDRSDELGPVRITHDGIAHSGGVHWPIVLPRSAVKHLELEYTPGADYPVAVSLFGALFALLGITMVALLVTRIEDLEMFGAFCLGLLLGGMGCWMLWFALKKRFVLIARTAHGPSRMVFPPNASRENVIEFATRAARRHGYPFDFGQGLIG